MDVAVGILIGLGAGVLSGMFGIGGGVVIVPILVFLGLKAHEATGTSLAALLLPVGLLGVLEYARRNHVKLLYAVGIAIGLTIGVFFGARFALKLSDVTLKRAFGVLLILISFRFLLAK